MSSLRVKLTLALLVTGLSSVIIMTALVQRFTTAEFDNFVVEQDRSNFIADMTAYYEVYGSWNNMRFARGRLPVSPPLSDDLPDMPPDVQPEMAEDVRFDMMAYSVQFTLTDRMGRVLIPNKSYAPGQVISEADREGAEPIVVDGETVGYVISSGSWSDHGALAEAYLDRINQLLLVAMGGAVALALILSVGFARSLSKPLREIAAAINSMSRGSLDQQVPVRSRDEVGQVAAAFNQMSANLARANHLRRQMTADIAHELRTPLSVVVGYLASMSEGLLKPTPERFKIMTDEGQHLQHLVEDLRVLSLADAGELPLNRQWVASGELVNMAAATFSHQAEQKQIALSVQIDPDLPLLHADPDRILQVLGNLLANALRHTPEQGRVMLASRREGDRICLSIQDSGPGIEPEHLPHVFERFYRADSSRHQESNESGLGLAIAKSIVEAHGGQLGAVSRVGEGATFTLTLPVLPQPAPAHAVGEQPGGNVTLPGYP